eukprot:3596442-Rhodomonas_salina.3
MTDFCLEKLQETQNLIWDESAAEFDKVRLRRYLHAKNCSAMRRTDKVSRRARIWEIAAGLVKRVPVTTLCRVSRALCNLRH